MFTNLEILDRATNESKDIPLTNNVACNAEIQAAADFNGISLKDAWKLLKDGQELVTFGYIRRLKGNTMTAETGGTIFLIKYRHDDCKVTPGVEWEDTHDCACNGECPACGMTDIEPVSYTETTDCFDDSGEDWTTAKNGGQGGNG